MSYSADDTILPPPRRPINSGGLDGDTVLPSQNAPGIHGPGDVIDNRYTVIREIGRGGMGVVYEVEDAVTEDRVALKRLLPELSGRADLTDVFKREGRNAIRFTSESPRFVTVRHIGLDSGGLYLVMDFVEDTTLRAMLEGEAERRLRVSTATVILVELASALCDLHGLGFVHRDLKPENIFVQQLGGDQFRVRLVDFGLTKDDTEGTRTSIRGAGTSGYASPEQRKGLPTTPATDIYAFGVIAYEMLTGELPSIGDLITDYVSDVPKYLVDLIVQCQATRPERRPQDGSELARLLSELPTFDSATQPNTVTDKAPPVQSPVVYTGTLVLSGVPEGAAVTIDGISVAGFVHIVNLKSDQQMIEIRIYCEGYADFVKAVALSASLVTEIAVEMNRKQIESSESNGRPLSRRVLTYPNLEAYIDSLRSIPGGQIQMGSTKYDDEKPVHTVRLSGFRLGATPVTVAVWKEYCIASGTKLPEAPSWGLLDDHPIVNVSWNDIMGVDGIGGFCAWVNGIVGFRVTLPTEAQWEYACRGGQVGLEFPWGNNFEESNLWCCVRQKRRSTAPVIRSSNVYRNPYGLTDLAGNVWEKCLDFYDFYPFVMDRTTGFAGLTGKLEKKPIGSMLDPKGPESGSKCCIRGGSWYSSKQDSFRCAYRSKGNPDDRYSSDGFRLSAGPG